MPNRLDQFYRSLVFSQYFTKGWGKPENLKKICEFRKIVSNREACYKLVSPDYPVYIEREEDGGHYNVIDGYFFTPFAHYLPEVVPAECRKAYFQMILPKKSQSESYKPIILQIAGTGDQYYWRRRNLIAKPLIKEAGIGSIILENPFYGRRKPKEQIRTVLQNVCDIFVMGGCLIFESMVLFHLCERLGYGPLGVTGLSMGGHMASLIAACWPKPLVVVPCLSGTTSSHVFTQGVISRALDWDMLEKQFHSDLSYKEEIAKMINLNDKDAYRAGQEFAARASNYSGLVAPSLADSSDQLNRLISREYAQVNGDENELDDGRKTWSTRSRDISSSKNFSSQLVSSSVLDKINDNDRVEDVSKTSSSFGSYSKNYKTLATLCANVRVADADTDDANILRNRANDKFSGHRLGSNKSDSGNSATPTAVENALYDNYRQLEKKYDVTVGSYYHYLLNYLSKFVPYSTATAGEANNLMLNEQQALSFMNGIMDEVTHLKNYPVPVDTSLVIAVCAEDDAYVPLKGMSKLDEVWPGAQVRYVKGGHVRAYVQYQKNFRSAIVDAFSKYRSTYLRTF